MQRVQDYGDSSVGDRPGPKFDPPVYRQRYQRVGEIIEQYKAKKVIDFGCAEAKLLRFLINGESTIEELVGVDIDGDLLKGSVFRIRPLTSDFLIPRPEPLTVSLYQGSISEADDRICGFDIVACVELVEHLVPEHLEAMPTVLLGQLSPKVAIVTTPNADFNVLFADLVGFRHWDHKFEWTRDEFEQWASSQARTFGYDVTFEGIGRGPPDTRHLGCCSQMALFIKQDTRGANDAGGDDEGDAEGDTNKKQQFGQPYNLIAEVPHPFRKCTLSEEEKILLEVNRLLWFLSQPTDYEEEEEEDYVEIEEISSKVFTLERLMAMPTLKKLCGTVERLREVLQDSKLDLTEDQNSVLYACPSEWSESENSDTETDWGTEYPENTCSSIDNKIESESCEDWDVSDDGNDKKTVCWTLDFESLDDWGGWNGWTEDSKNNTEEKPLTAVDTDELHTLGNKNSRTGDYSFEKRDSDSAKSDEQDDDYEYRPSILGSWQAGVLCDEDNGDDDDGQYDDADEDLDIVTGVERDGIVWIIPDDSADNCLPDG